VLERAPRSRFFALGGRHLDEAKAGRKRLTDLIDTLDRLAMPGPASLVHPAVRDWTPEELSALCDALSYLRAVPGLLDFPNVPRLLLLWAAESALSGRGVATDREACLAHAEAALFETSVRSAIRELQEIGAAFGEKLICTPDRGEILTVARKLLRHLDAFRYLATRLDAAPVIYCRLVAAHRAARHASEDGPTSHQQAGAEHVADGARLRKGRRRRECADPATRQAPRPVSHRGGPGRHQEVRPHRGGAAARLARCHSPCRPWCRTRRFGCVGLIRRRLRAPYSARASRPADPVDDGADAEAGAGSIDPRELAASERHIKDCEDLLTLATGLLPTASLDIHYRWPTAS
jgi:hypothetical protein